MKELILLLLVISATAGPHQAPNEWQDADAAWLANKIYEGSNTMNTDSGYVFHCHNSRQWVAYALWKEKKAENAMLL